MGSVQECPQVVDDYVQKECQRGSVLGPLSGVPEAEVHISRFGIIPKSGQPESGVLSWTSLIQSPGV